MDREATLARVNHHLYPAITDFAEFVRGQSHILSARPWLIFQQAANRPDASAVSRMARWRWEGGSHTRPWLRWVDKPTFTDPCTLTCIGHMSSVNRCLYSPDGSFIISASADGTLKRWDPETGRGIATLTGDRGSVTDAALSPDGRRIISGGYDSTLNVWDIQTGDLLNVLKGHTGPVNACAYSPDGRTIVSASDDGTLRTWDPESGAELSKRAGRTYRSACAYSPNGRLIVDGYDDYYVRRNACGFSPDGRRVVSAISFVLRDATNLRSLARSASPSKPSYTLRAEDTGDLLPTGFGDPGELWIRDATDGKNLTPLFGHDNRVNTCTYSPNGLYIASGSEDWTVRIWDAATAEPIAVLVGHHDSVRTCDFSPDGGFVVSGSGDGEIKIWDLEAIVRLAGQGLLSGDRGYPAEARLYGVDFARSECTLSPDGTRVASSNFSKAIRIQDFANGAELDRLSGEYTRITACSYSPDGTHIVIGSHTETEQREPLLVILDARSGEEVTRICGEDYEIMTCNYSPDGRRIVAAESINWAWEASGEGFLSIWDTATGSKLVETAPTDIVTCCAISPDGRLILSGSFDNTLRIWDARTGTQLSALEGHRCPVRACGFSPDGRRIVSGADFDPEYADETLKIWDTSAGRVIKHLPGHTDSVNGCAYTPDGRRIVSVSSDTTVRVWEEATGAEETLFRADRLLDSVAVSQYGIAARDSSGKVYILHFVGFDVGPPFLTPVRLHLEEGRRWSGKITAKCDWCGERFLTPGKVLDTIRRIQEDAKMSENEPPCTALQLSARLDRHLTAVCTKCHNAVRFNPFIVDERHQESAEGN